MAARHRTAAGQPAGYPTRNEVEVSNMHILYRTEKNEEKLISTFEIVLICHFGEILCKFEIMIKLRVDKNLVSSVFFKAFIV